MSRAIKITRLTLNDRQESVHIEVPGCIVNICTGLSTPDGKEVTRVDIDADGDRFAGEPQWWCPDLAEKGLDAKGIGIRVVQTDIKPEFRIIESVTDELDEALKDIAAEAAWNQDSETIMTLRFLSEVGQSCGMEDLVQKFRSFLEQTRDRELAL